MGLLDKFFGGKKNFPVLKDGVPGARELKTMHGSLEKLSREVSDPMEIVPYENSAYVFIGKPPKSFGMAWIEEGKICNFKTLSEEKKVPQAKLSQLVSKLGEAYEHSMDDKRYSASIAGKDVVVTPSSSLAEEVREILGNA